MEYKFEIIFIEEAMKEYIKLDGSSKNLVDIALAKLTYRANELGEALNNQINTNLAGCRRIKYRKIEIRIVFRFIGDHAEIVEIIAIEKRNNNEVYKNATKRLRET